MKDLIGPVKVMLDAYCEGNIDRLFLVNAQFLNTMTQKPQTQQLLPIETLDCLALRGPVRDTPLLAPHLDSLRPGRRTRVGMWVCQVAEYIRANFTYARDATDASSPIDHLLERG